MIFWVNKTILRRNFDGMTIWPLIIIRNASLRSKVNFMNHERIHYRQQIELLVLPFYVLYGLEFLLRWFQYRNRYLAYRNISFEREAYKNESDLSYLKKRRFWSFINYYRKIG